MGKSPISTGRVKNNIRMLYVNGEKPLRLVRLSCPPTAVVVGRCFLFCLFDLLRLFGIVLKSKVQKQSEQGEVLKYESQDL